MLHLLHPRLRLLHRQLLVPDIRDALLLRAVVRPLGVVRQGLQLLVQARRQEPRPGVRVQPQHEGRRQRLGHGHLVRAVKERARVFQQRLDFLPDRLDDLARLGRLCRALGAHGFEPLRVHLGEEGVDEEVDLGPVQGCGGGGVRGWEQVRGEAVGEELAHDGAFGQDLGEDAVVVFDGGDETSLWGCVSMIPVGYLLS